MSRARGFQPAILASARRRAALRSTVAAASLLFVPMHHAFAEDDQPSPSVLSDAELRLDDIDLAQGFRRDAGTIGARPFTTTQPIPDQDLDGPPAADAAPDDRPSDARDAGAAPQRPRFDLFDGPASTKTGRQNPVVAAVAPAAPQAPDVAARAETPFDPVNAPTLFAAPPVIAPTRLAPDDREADTPSGTTGILSTAPIRPSRLDQTGNRLNLRTLPLRSPFPVAASDPFAPLGLRLGSFLLYSAVEQSIGVSSNLEGAPGGSGGAFSDTALSARLVSNWSRHSAELEALANYRRNFAGAEPSQPDVTLNGIFRLDVDRATTATLEGGFDYRREDDSDLDPLVGSQERADRFDYRAAGALERAFGRAFVRGSLAALRETVSGGERTIGSPDQDFDTYAGTVRAGYRLTPAFAPFVEGGLGRRVFDDRNDAELEQDSLIETLRGGFAFDFGEKLNGEIAAGYAANRPDEDALKAITAPTIDARLNWSPRRGTDIVFTAATAFDPDPLGTSTATLYQAGIAAQHRATSRLALSAAFTGGYRDSDLATDVERTWDVSLGFTYWVNRSLAFTGLASHREVNREEKASDYDVDSIKFGLRLQN